MTLRLADASDLPIWSWQTWFILALIAAAVWLFLAIDHAPLMDPEPDALDVLDGIERCHLRCNRVGTVPRIERADLGGRLVRVCPGHSDEGDIKEWWAS